MLHCCLTYSPRTCMRTWAGEPMPVAQTLRCHVQTMLPQYVSRSVIPDPRSDPWVSSLDCVIIADYLYSVTENVMLLPCHKLFLSCTLPSGSALRSVPYLCSTLHSLIMVHYEIETRGEFWQGEEGCF